MIKRINRIREDSYLLGYEVTLPDVPPQQSELWTPTYPDISDSNKNSYEVNNSSDILDGGYSAGTDGEYINSGGGYAGDRDVSTESSSGSDGEARVHLVKRISKRRITAKPVTIEEVCTRGVPKVLHTDY